jgi:mRNA interferase YafQ
VRLALNRGKDMAKLREASLPPVESSPWPPHYHDRPPGGGWRHFRDLHCGPAWLSIYKIEDDDLHVVRTGTHANPF